MSKKIIRLEDKQDSLINFLKNTLKMAEKGEIKNILIASFLDKKDDNCYIPEVLTGYYNLNHLERQYLVASLQTDINYNVVKANVDDLIEIINR